MSGNVDHVVDAAQDAIVPVGSNQRAVTREVGPVAPIFALRVFVVLLVILLHETVVIAPNRLNDSRPGIADADVARLVLARLDLLVVLVEDDRIDSRQSRSR